MQADLVNRVARANLAKSNSAPTDTSNRQISGGPRFRGERLRFRNVTSASIRAASFENKRIWDNGIRLLQSRIKSRECEQREYFFSGFTINKFDTDEGLRQKIKDFCLTLLVLV